MSIEVGVRLGVILGSLALAVVLTAEPARAQVSIAAPRGSVDYEARIDAALARQFSLNFVDTPLRDIIEHFARQTGVQFKISKKIEDAGVQIDQPVTASFRELSAESALSLMLHDLNLTFMVQHEVVIVTTVEDAQSPENMIVRVYPVADLVEAVRSPASQGGGVWLDFDSLTELISANIEPDSWQDVGGPASITGDDHSRSLVIAQRRDLHQKIAGTLTALRRAKAVQGIPSSASPTATNLQSTTPARLSAPLPVPNRGAASSSSFRSSTRPPTPPRVGGGGLF